MTNYTEVKSRYLDELNDVIAYANLSKNADNSMEKQFFRDIAKEEYEHAHALKHILKKAGQFTEDDNVHTTKDNAKKALDEI